MRPIAFETFSWYNVVCTSPSRRAGRCNSHPSNRDAAYPLVAPAVFQATRQRHHSFMQFEVTYGRS